MCWYTLVKYECGCKHYQVYPDDRCKRGRRNGHDCTLYPDDEIEHETSPYDCEVCVEEKEEAEREKEAKAEKEWEEFQQKYPKWGTRLWQSWNDPLAPDYQGKKFNH